MGEKVTPGSEVAQDQNRNTWETFAHDADIGIRGRGKSLEEAFSHAALALTSVITNPLNVTRQAQVKIQCQELDIELLFLDFINALIFEMDTKRMIFGNRQVKIDGSQLEVLAQGEIIDVLKHDPAVEVKGATLTELKVYKEQELWCAQCIVDV